MPADLEALVTRRDHRGLAGLLTDLDDDGTVAARRWYRATGRRLAQDAVAGRRDRDAGTVVVLLAVGLAGARDAARACDFPRETRYGRVGGERLLPVLEIAARRGPEWCRDFVEAVSQRPVLASWASPDEVVAVCLPLVAHHGLDVPGGPAYPHGWASLAVESQRSQDAGELENHLARLDETGRAAYVPGLTPSAGLRALLAATPQPQQTLERVLETPRALSVLTYLDRPGWLLGPALEELLAGGAIDRARLVASALRSLDAGHRPSEQRVAATFLQAAGFGPADAAARVPFLLQVLGTAHGSVTASLLPVLLAAPLDPDDLRELGSVVLLRREKAQKVVLLEWLEHVPHGDPRAGTVAGLLAEAARLDDRALAGRAERALRSRGAVVAAPEPDVVLADVAWDDPPAPAPVEAFRRPPATAAGLAQLRAEQRPDLLKESRWLDLVVRRAASDPEGLRSEVQAWPHKTWVDSTVEQLLTGWATGAAPASSTSWLPVRGHRLLTTALVAETFDRLGTVSELLSTPSHEDGTIAWTDLVERLRRAAPAGYAPVDLLQALLRLEPVRSDRLGLLDGLVVEPHRPRTGPRRWWSRRTAPQDDAASVLRAWVERGGLPVRRATVVAGYADLAPTILPAVPPRLQGDPMVEGLTAGLRSSPTNLPTHGSHHGLQADRYLAVVPGWAEVLAADEETERLEHRGSGTAPFADMVRSPGPFGPAVHLHAARGLADPDAAERTRGAELVLAAGSRRLDRRLLAEQSAILLEAGALSLARSSDGWEQVVLGGGLALVWPSIETVLDRATTTRPLPAGLAELLRMVRPYVAVVVANTGGGGDDVLPAGVAALAGSPSATKARAEARALLDAVTLAKEAV